MLINLKNYFYIEKSIFSKEDCENIINYSEQNWENENLNRDFEYRKSKVKFLSPSHPEVFSFINKLMPIVENIKKQKWRTFKLSRLQPMQYTTYDAPYGNYNWHTDTSDRDQPSMASRLLSFTIQLTNPLENYEGGNFEIIEELSQNFSSGKTNTNWNLEKKKTIEHSDFPQGSILVFPSLLGHRVTQVTKGTRKSLVGWIDGTMI